MSERETCDWLWLICTLTVGNSGHFYLAHAGVSDRPNRWGRSTIIMHYQSALELSWPECTKCVQVLRIMDKLSEARWKQTPLESFTQISCIKSTIRCTQSCHVCPATTVSTFKSGELLSEKQFNPMSQNLMMYRLFRAVSTSWCDVSG